MKKKGIVVLIIVLIVSSQIHLFSKYLKEKIVYTEKEFEITDGSKDFYFRYPSDFKADKFGNLYLFDFYHLYKFNNKGKFIKKILKNGAGPGEVLFGRSVFYYSVYSHGLIGYSSLPLKIMHFDNSGKFVKEFRLNKFFPDSFIGYYKKRYFFIDEEEPFGKSGKFLRVKVHRSVVGIDDKSNVVFEKKFMISYLFMRYQGARIFFDEPPTEYIILGDYLYLLISNNYEFYQIKLSDSSKIIKISRNYNRVKRSKANERYFKLREIGVNNRMFKEPYRKYIKDIICFANPDNKTLWVITTTKNRNNGIWVDEYRNGKLKGGFWLNLPKNYDVYKLNKKRFLIANNSIFLKTVDEDDNVIITKYRLVFKK